MGKKAIKFFDNFFIFHKNGIKILLNCSINKCPTPPSKKKNKNKNTNKQNKCPTPIN